MTLVVYSGRKFYADDLVLADPDEYHFRKKREPCKIHVCKPNDMVVAMCGNLPWARDRKRVIGGLGKLIFYAETGEGEDAFFKAFSDEKIRKEFLKVSFLQGGATYLIATKHCLYSIDNEGLSILRPDFEYAYGSGNTFFGICRKSGLSVEEAFAKTAEYNRTVGQLAQTVDLSNMTDLVQNVITAMTEEGSPEHVTTAKKLQEIYNRQRKEVQE